MRRLVEIYFIVFHFLLCFPAKTLQDVCPSTCECFGTIVDCSDNGLNQVPEDIPAWVEQLNLSKNPSLKFGNDSFTDLPNLKTLALGNLKLDEVPDIGNIPTVKSIDLSSNKISDASAPWSEMLPRVHDLDFTKNSFQHLDLSQISSLPIRKIDFKSNSISTVSPEASSLSSLIDLRLPRNLIDDEAFKNLSLLFDHMTNLKQLDLNRNLIEKPQGLMFKNMSSLLVLKLKRNKIIDLPAGVFFGLISLTTLRLDNNSNISEINNGWLFDQNSLKVLSLSHNKVELIKENAWSATKKLSILDLSFNELGCRHSEPNFEGLRNLQELYLAHNCFANIDTKTFGELSRLKTLDLAYNQLQLSVEYDVGAFGGLKSLVSLNLAYNKIETIHGNVFHQLTSLVTLDLSGNSIKTLPQNPFRALGKLQLFSFNATGLVCDCSLEWLPDFLKSRPYFPSSDFTCGFPESLRGRAIANLKKRHLHCKNSPQPVISEFPDDQTVLYGKNMTLECVAHAGGGEPSFTWTKNRKVVEPFRVKTFMSVEDDESTKMISQFYIDNVTHSNGGIYQCIARNDFGPSYSLPARITVHRLPYFTERPASVEVKEGGSIEFKCSASGYPVPEILINKEGDFSAPREKRLFYVSDKYFIKPVLPRDDGVYVCTARNEAGIVNATARVSVIHTPSFSRAPQNQAAALGQSIALECQGTGQPKPKVIWYKENRLVVPDNNHVLLEDGQFLLLLSVNKEDIGTYLCELTNRLGTQRRKVNLTMKQEVFFPAITGLIIMIVVSCVVLTSFLWVVIIYNMRRKTSTTPNAGKSDEPVGPDQLLETFLPKKEIPLAVPTLNTFAVPAGQDSASEHSSGKDSGVGESHQRSNEDLHRQRKSLIIYPESPNGLALKGRSCSAPRNGDEIRPRLSSFNQNQMEAANRSYNPTYASLRRGSTSRLLAVPTPVTPGGGLGMNSLPRHAYRSHSSKYSIYDNTASLSRRRPSVSRSVCGEGPRSVRGVDEDDDPRIPMIKSDDPKAPMANSVRPGSIPKHNSGGIPMHNSDRHRVPMIKSGIPTLNSDETIKVVPNFYSYSSTTEEPLIIPNGVHVLPSR